MASFVICGHDLVFLANNSRLRLGAHHDLVLGEFEIQWTNLLVPEPCCMYRSLVDEVLEVCSREAACSPSEQSSIDVWRYRNVAHMVFDDLNSASDIW